MKLLIPGLLLLGALAAGLAVGLFPRPAAAVASAAPSSFASAPVVQTSAMISAGHQPPADSRWSGDPGFTPSVCGLSMTDRDRASQGPQPSLVARDPALAGHQVLASAPGAERDELLRQFVREWAAIDLGGTLTWVTSLLDEADRRNAATALTAQVAQDDPAGAIELAQLLHVGVDDGSLERRVQLWTEEKPGEALDWIVRRPADPLRDRLLARIAWTRAQREPAEAAGLVLTHMPPGDARDEALLGVVRQWAVRDPAPASAWVASFPAGPLHTRALAELAVAGRLR